MTSDDYKRLADELVAWSAVHGPFQLTASKRKIALSALRAASVKAGEVVGEPVAWLRYAVDGDAPKPCNEDDDGAFPVYRAATPAPTASVGAMRTLQSVLSWDDQANPASYGGLPEWLRQEVITALAAASQSDGGVCTAPASCPNCFNEDDCANVDTCNAVADVYNQSDTPPDWKQDQAETTRIKPRPSDTRIIGTAGTYAIDDRASFIPKDYLTNGERESLEEFNSLNIVPGPRKTPPAPQAVEAAWEPTDAQINSACLSFRHDYGLLHEDDRRQVQFEAVEWLRAWQKEGFGCDSAEVQ
ncbi:MAG: hypothetical protein WBF99_12585 [Xanthobacteraceae bacterium]